MSDDKHVPRSGPAEPTAVIPGAIPAAKPFPEMVRPTPTPAATPPSGVPNPHEPATTGNPARRTMQGRIAPRSRGDSVQPPSTLGTGRSRPDSGLLPFTGSSPSEITGTPMEPGQVPQPGMRIAHYELIRELGTGGMGTVFLARDLRLGRKVAIKILQAQDPELARRFLVEARATARCHHENIVVIYEVGAVGDQPYMVLEYLK